MKLIIDKGNHYPFFPLSLPKWVNKNNITTMKREIMFTESCLYDLKDEDQGDVNKLFGFSIGFHHKTSFRFGWRADLKTSTIEIVAYEYHDNLRQTTMPICRIDINKYYKFRIVYIPNLQRTYYEVRDVKEFTNEFNLKKKYGLGYTLGLYFGGNEKAPQKIVVYKK